MSSRELLELAAKAYWGDEIDDVCSVEWDESCQCIAYTHAGNQDHNGNDQTFIWNPHTDDGDSRRLQAALRISLEFGEVPFKGRYARAKVTVPCTDGSGHVWEHDAIEYALTPNDMERAARYAVLHVAAAIGKEMP